MSQLTSNLRRKLIDALLRLPGIEDADMRDQLLLDLPDGLEPLIERSQAALIDLSVMLERADEWGVSALSQLLDNALHLAPDSVAGQELAILCQQLGITYEVNNREQTPITTDHPNEPATPPRPTGTVTFLFTNIEGSTQQWEHDEAAMQAALRRHDTLLRTAIETQQGYVFKTVGDGFYVSFARPQAALAAALAVQHAAVTEPWDEVGPLHIRMALHTGNAEDREGDYVGRSVNRAAGLLAVAHGGQILISQATYDLLSGALPADVSLTYLGEHHLRDLPGTERIYQVTADGLPHEFLHLKTIDERLRDLPMMRTPFVGREAEIAEVKQLLAEQRLVTLTGAGGTGKTRLALQVAADLLNAFADGVFVVSLATIRNPALVASTIAQALEIKETEQPLEKTIGDTLRDKELLLLLDNFEQVITAVSLVDSLLDAAPQLKMLVTSREPLNLSGEYEYLVPVLAVPDIKRLPALEQLNQYEAVQLFVERARAHNRTFALTTANALAVAEICARLDGLPLAIELVAVHIRTLPPRALLARMDHRLPLLKDGPANAPDRQRTMWAAIEWSYDLLTQREQLLFRRLAVFQGGRTLDALEAVCNWDHTLNDEVLNTTTALVSKSLLLQREDAEGEPRFTLLETIHEYGLEQLEASGEAVMAGQQHTRFFLTLAESAESQLRGPDQARWLVRLESEHDNLRAAIERAIAVAEYESALRLTGTLWRFWYIRGYWSEGRQWLEASLKRGEDADGGTWAKALNGAGSLAYAQGDLTNAQKWWEQSRDLHINRELKDNRALAAILNNLGLVAHAQGDYSQAESLITESLDLRRQYGDEWGFAVTLLNLALVKLAQGNYQAAQPLLEESLVLLRRIGDKERLAQVLLNLGVVARVKQDYANTQHWLEDSMAVSREIGATMHIAQALIYLGQMMVAQGQVEQARAKFLESLGLIRVLDDKRLTAECVEGLASVAQLQGQPERAGRLFGAAAALRSAIKAMMSPIDRPDYEHHVSAAREQMTEETWQATWAAGQAMTADQAIDFALEGT